MKTVLKITLCFLSTLWISCAHKPTEEEYLKKVLSNLEKIETATYYMISEAWRPGDTIPASTSHQFYKEYNNPADSTIGASFVAFEDSIKLHSGYNGEIKVLTYHEHNGIIIDDFTSRDLPFRLVSPPFFNYTKNIIQYALTTDDNITIELKELENEYYFKLIIDEDKQVEFFGKAHYMPEPPPLFYRDPLSQYELWISKSKGLPYKVRREMSHSISAETCLEAELNQLSLNDFDLYSYFPDGYEIRKRGENKQELPPLTELIGKKAPEWTLNDLHEQPLSLSDLTSKVILINFTGIGCLPCHAAVPFLKELKSKYTPEEFELIGIESWARTPHSLRIYSQKNDLNYTLLSATDEIIENYRSRSSPVFFILDKNQIIKKIITGYKGEETDNEIMETIRAIL